MPRSPPDLSTVLANRFECLSALVDRPRTKTELEDVVNYSRSTVDRAVRDLRDAGLAVYVDGVWRPTYLGQGAYHARTTYLADLEHMEATASVVDCLSLDDPIGCEILDDARVHEAPSPAPDAVMNKFLDYVGRGTAVRVATPTVMLGYAEEFYQRVSSNSSYELELIVEKRMFEQLFETCPSLTEDLMDDPSVTFNRATIAFSFGLWLVDHDHVGLIVFTDQAINGLLVNDSDAAIDWATDLYRDIKQDSQPVFSRGSLP